MPDYRLYCLDRDGKFTNVHQIEADNDADAVSKARKLKLSVKCELWERGRMVAALNAPKPDELPA